jgi:Zn-dependent protease with chaperone function
MQAREQSHRRFVLWGIGAVLLLSLSPVVGHHLSTRLDAALMGQDHAWIICLIALHALLAPVHGLFHVLLIAGLLYALYDRLQAAWRVRMTLRMLVEQPGPASPAIRAAVQLARVPAHSLRVVRRLANPAFTAGWWSPKIYVAEEIADVLTEAQLAAVLAHEAEHVRRRDPLRLSLLRFLGCTLFWIPAFRRLVADMADEAEIAADDAAAGERPLVLASAILAMATWRGPQLGSSNASSLPSGAVVGLVPDQDARRVRPDARRVRPDARRVRPDALLDRRVRRLAGETAVVSSHLTRRSLFGAAAILSAVWVSGIVVAHPMPSGTTADAAHCSHAHEHPLAHLFCRLDHPRDGASFGTRCPHAHGVAHVS